jgi:uncharacterized protein YcnI
VSRNTLPVCAQPGHVHVTTPRPSRLVASALAGAAATLLLAQAAAAHVTVNPNTASQGGYAKLAFRAPTESATASTTSLEVDLPTDHPILSVLTQPVPGWTARVVKTKLAKPLTGEDGQVTEAVSSITWTGGSIPPGQFQEFNVSVGPLPKDTDKLVFKALQTYSDGTVVRWIDLPTAAVPKPEHPAPTLTLTGASASSTGSASTPAPAPAASGSDGTARGLGIAGTALGALGLAAGAVALTRRNTKDQH